MGFDVNAYYPNEGSAVSTRLVIEAAFAEAKHWLEQNAGGYDGFISLGSLDCMQSIRHLEQAIGRKFEPTNGDIWVADKVRQLSESAVWADPSSISDDDRWAYWSARKFLEICVQHGLGIWTS